MVTRTARMRSAGACVPANGIGLHSCAWRGLRPPPLHAGCLVDSTAMGALLLNSYYVVHIFSHFGMISQPHYHGTGCERHGSHLGSWQPQLGAVPCNHREKCCIIYDLTQRRSPQVAECLWGCSAGGARAAGAGGDHAAAGGAVRRQCGGGGVLRQGGRRIPAGHVAASAQQVHTPLPNANIPQKGAKSSCSMARVSWRKRRRRCDCTTKLPGDC
jgi:hypothetical protein